MSEDLDNAISILEQNVSGKVPPWQKALEVATDIFHAPESFANTYTLGATGALNKAMGVDNYQPKTEIGQGVNDVFSVLPVVEGAKALAELPRSLSKMLEIRKVEKIQKSFLPWVKKNQGEYAKVFKSGIKNAVAQGKYTTNPVETNVIFSPIINATEDSLKQLPRKAIEVAERVKGNPKGIKELIQEKSRLRRSLSVAERTGKVSTERSRIIKRAISNIDNTVKKNVPEIVGANKPYGEYSEAREFMTKNFEPWKANLGKLGTAKGTSTLRNISKLQPAEEEILLKYGKETGIPIVGPARVASGLRNAGNFISRYLPWAVGGGWLYNKLGRQQGDNTPS